MCISLDDELIKIQQKTDEFKYEFLRMYIPLWNSIICGKSRRYRAIVETHAGTGYVNLEDEKQYGSSLLFLEKTALKQEALDFYFIEKNHTNFKELSNSIEDVIKKGFYFSGDSKGIDLVGKVRDGKLIAVEVPKYKPTTKYPNKEHIFLYPEDCLIAITKVLPMVAGRPTFFFIDPCGKLDWQLIELIINDRLVDELGDVRLDETGEKFQGTELLINFSWEAISRNSSTKLKKELREKFFQDMYCMSLNNMWWKITSGGQTANYSYATTIVEMNAATGEIYIEETDETILGSACCALELKFNNTLTETPNLNIILVEENEECINHLKNVIERRYPEAEVNELLSNDYFNTDCILLRKNVTDAINTITTMGIDGRCLFFFDPLLSVDMNPLRVVYYEKVMRPSTVGLEFIIFFFTSDWLYGRNNFHKLPDNTIASNWSDEEQDTINKLDNVLGDDAWREKILTNETEHIRMVKLIKEYQKRLFELFRFVEPMPFSPKEDQLYHLIFCSNFMTGARLISDFYKNATGNTWNPDNSLIYQRFKRRYQGVLNFPIGNRRPSEWKLLWNFIRNYNNGKFDLISRDVRRIESDRIKCQDIFDWLEEVGFIRIYSTFRYGRTFNRFELNWDEIRNKLDLNPPPEYEPLKPDY